MFRRLLVANRGEIAVRVIRAARELGVSTVAVHSDADRDALHVRMADQAVRIGPAPAAQSYLRGDAIVAAALATGAEAIHPGYGFLSENAAFAEAVGKAGLAFVGPNPQAMRRMGDKTRARAEAQAAGVPVAPGSGPLRDAGHARAEAERIGYPVLLKAVAGGGGIGMRPVHSSAEMEAQFEAATRQATAAFGNGSVFLERLILRPRHVEVQVLGDRHGHLVHLYERECSIQRRHQKLVEEAPSPALAPQQREELGAQAVALARRVGYDNAGTLEFLYEPAPGGAGGRFHFNEMNTRLQVEHPVTEMVTGLDLVQLQLRVAAGEELPLRQSDVRLRGHAIEVRINAEDARRGFAPSSGRVTRLRLPQGPGVRTDTFLEEGCTVPPDYDSLLLKLACHAGDRDGAVRRLQRALGELDLRGPTTNADLHRALCSNAAFRTGDLSTRFLEEHTLLAPPDTAEAGRLAAAVAVALAQSPEGVIGRAAHPSTPPRKALASGVRDWGAA